MRKNERRGSISRTVCQQHRASLQSRMRRLAAVLLTAVAITASAAPPKTIAPATIPHPIALFLGDLSHEGKTKVTFRAAARGTHFFFEEPAGVTIYVYVDGTGYQKQSFVKNATLAAAMKKYR
jgi:hypothetical protein